MSTVDWSVLDEVVMDACLTAANYVSRQFPDSVERDDFLQEAYILCATRAEDVTAIRALADTDYFFTRWLIWQLMDVADREGRFHRHTVSFDDELVAG